MSDSLTKVVENYIELNDPSLPFLNIILEENISDVSICKGPNYTYYLTGTTGDKTGVQQGIKVWASRDLTNWNIIGTNDYVWTFDEDGSSWQKELSTQNGWRQRGMIAPKIHYLKNTFWITYTNSNSNQSGILKSTSGRAQGPYIEIGGNKPLVSGTNASLFIDSDSSVYFIWDNGKIQKMNPDISGFDAIQTDYLKDSLGNMINASAVLITKIENKYVLSASMWNPLWNVAGNSQMSVTPGVRYDGVVATSENLFGPYVFQKGVIPHAGGGSLLVDFEGKFWHTISGADVGSPISGQPCLLPLEVNSNREFLIKHPFDFGVVSKMNTVYVSPFGNNSNGSCWENAFTSLQRAIDYAPEKSQIWIATGTYETFQINLRNGLYLYGGFKGNEKLLNQRNIEENKVIINGKNIAKHVISIWSSTYIRLDGITIQGGNASGGSFQYQYGGGVHILGGGETIRLVNCHFENNKSNLDGGALYISVGAAPTIINCSFVNNLSKNNGGAIAVYCNSINGYHCKIFNSTFEQNYAYGDGGAIYFDTNFKDFGLLTILNCLMVNNSTLKGGGIITLDRNSNLLLMNSTLSLNKGSSQGAVIASLGKVPAKSYIVNTIISGNEGGTLFSIEGEAEYVSTTNKLISPNVWVHFVNSLFENRSTGMQVQRNFDRKKWRTINDLNESVMGTNCLQGDPEFVDPDNGNFRLENGSRARNAGNLTYFFPFNIEGSNRDISKISLGCY